jgi:hypothetical protein
MMRQYGRRQGDGPQHGGEEKVLVVMIGGYAVALSSCLCSNEWKLGRLVE